jgi:hypothetical protein
MPTTPSSVPSNTNVNVVSSSSSSSSSTMMMMMMNPNQRVLLELQKALDTCRARNSLQQHENRTWWKWFVFRMGDECDTVNKGESTIDKKIYSIFKYCLADRNTVLLYSSLSIWPRMKQWAGFRS